MLWRYSAASWLHFTLTVDWGICRIVDSKVKPGSRDSCAISAHLNCGCAWVTRPTLFRVGVWEDESITHECGLKSRQKSVTNLQRPFYSHLNPAPHRHPETLVQTLRWARCPISRRLCLPARWAPPSFPRSPPPSLLLSLPLHPTARLLLLLLLLLGVCVALVAVGGSMCTEWRRSDRKSDGLLRLFLWLF